MKNKFLYIIISLLILNTVFLTACNDNSDKPDINVSVYIKSPDSIILNEYTVTVKDGDSVLTAVSAACEDNDIELKYSGAGGFAYIKSIGGYKEFGEGSSSGWIYMVNKEKPNVGIGSKKLSDGDIIRLYYSLDLGEDVVWEE